MALVSDFDGFIFDYGGVLVHHQTDADRAQMAAVAEADPEKFSDCYWNLRDNYDKGAISGVEYWQRIAGCAEAPLTDKAIDQLVELDNVSWMQFDSIMWDWIDELRNAGKRLAILSNMPMELGQALRSKTNRFSCFDHITLSYEVRAIKPDPVIYEHCMDGLGTAPQKTLFLDDRIANVQGAEVLGIRAIQFTSRDEVLLKIRA